MNTLRAPGMPGRKRRSSRFLFEKLSGNELHYDLRLESRGQLKSWAVAGGPSTSPGERRTALRLEDTPEDELDFRDSEELMVWDEGTYRCLDRPQGPELALSRGLERGRLWLDFAGERIRGLYELVRVTADLNDEDEEWLLIRALEDVFVPSAAS